MHEDGSLTKNEIRVIRYLGKAGAATVDDIYNDTAVKGHPGHFLGDLMANGLVKEIDGKYSLTGNV
jgi:hypothetical protein